MTESYPLAFGDYVIDLYEALDSIEEDAIVDLWLREGAVTPEEARKRIPELSFIAVHGSDVVATSTAYLEWTPRLRLDLWRYRTFVAAGHRESGVAAAMANHAHDYAAERFVSGEDRTAMGALLEIENEMLKRHANLGKWPPYGYTFIGENKRGDHVRVGYYPGAELPDDA